MELGMPEKQDRGNLSCWTTLGSLSVPWTAHQLRFFLMWERYTLFLIVVLDWPGNHLSVTLPMWTPCAWCLLPTAAFWLRLVMCASPLAGASVTQKLLPISSVTVEQIWFRQHRKLSCLPWIATHLLEQLLNLFLGEGTSYPGVFFLGLFFINPRVSYIITSYSISFIIAKWLFI